MVQTGRQGRRRVRGGRVRCLCSSSTLVIEAVNQPQSRVGLGGVPQLAGSAKMQGCGRKALSGRSRRWENRFCKFA